FVKRTFELIAPLQPILHRVSCSNEMVPSAPKHSEMHQNLEWIGLICCRKILTQLCGLNFCIYYNCSSRFQPSIVKQRNGPKCIQTLWNQTKVCGPMGWIGCIRCDKFRHDFVASTFALIAQVYPILHRVSCSNKMVSN